MELDLNTRERTRYADMLRGISTHLATASEAIRNLDDDKAVVYITLGVLLNNTVIKELTPILVEAKEAAKLRDSLKEM